MRRARDFLPRGLFGRSLLIVAVPLAALQAVSAFVFYNRHWEDVGRRLALSLGGEIALLAEAAEERGGAVDPAWLLRRASLDLGVEAVFLPGERLPEEAPRAGFDPVARTLARVLPERIPHPFHFDTRAGAGRVSVAVELPSGLLRASAPRKRLFSSTTYIFIMWMFGTSVVLCGLAIHFLRRQVGPIRRLAEAADSFGKGEAAPALKPEGAREVRRAARAFLRMRDRIRRQMAQRTEMLAGVSHDLRTPLTRMKLQLALIPDDEAARELEADLGDMERMIGAYLAFARGEGGEESAETDLDALVDSALAGARRRGAALSLANRAPGLRPRLRAGAIKRALVNLVDNALRHGRSALLTVARRGDEAVLTLDDDGPGIPADRREAVFRPFFRLDAARNPDTGGVGLGLSIARDAVRNHGGDIELADSPLGGLRARVTLPL